MVLKDLIGCFEHAVFSEEEMNGSYGDSNLIVKIKDMAIEDKLRKKALNQPPEWLEKKELRNSRSNILKHELF